MESSSLGIIAARKIEQYLAGTLNVQTLIEWAWAQEVDEPCELPQGPNYWSVQDGIWAIRMLASSEPDEYRTSREELEQAMHYLRGDVPFPKDRIPSDNLKGLITATANAIEEYLDGRRTKEDLANWASLQEDLLEDLDLSGTKGYDVVQYALRVITGAPQLEYLRHRRPDWDLLLAVRYLRGKIAFSKWKSISFLPPQSNPLNN